MEEADIHIKSRHFGSEGDIVYKDGVPVGRVAKLVYSYVQEKDNGYIIAQKGALKIDDKVLTHGHEGIITEKRFLDW